MNQRDQAHAYRFLTRRLSSALVRDDPDGPDAPMRRLAIASFGSIMIAALAVAGVGVFGVLRPGGATAWKNGQAMILEKETGSRYLYLGGELHPVLNYTSARLVLGQPTFSIVSVSHASLSAATIGAPIGIQGAPDELPTRATLVSGPWTVCSRPALDQSGAPTAIAALSVGGPVAGSPLGISRGLLVTSTDGHFYLVWNGLRHLIPGGQAALTALSYTGFTPVVVADAWLSVMPEGTDLKTPPIAGRLGSRGPAVGGRPSKIGQVFVAAGTSSYYLAERGGLAPLSRTGALLTLADPAIRALYPAGLARAVSVPSAAIAAVPALGDASPQDQPRRPPPLLELPGGQGDVCVAYPAGSASSPQVRTAPVAAAAIRTWTQPRLYDKLGIPLADQVELPAGDGAVVEAASGLGAGTVYLITSQGIKYPLASAGLLASLGLPGVHPAQVPEVLLELLRTGPTLDRAAARHTVTP
jgi:type VII secretion protein EccB